MTAARAFARNKPIVAYKAGRFQESAAVAVSHTGAIASEDTIYDAAFQRTGIARVFGSGKFLTAQNLLEGKKSQKAHAWGLSPMPEARALWPQTLSLHPVAPWQELLPKTISPAQ